jgi:hypothetical protein
VKLVGAAVLVFVLARIVIPDLVNAHDTPLLLLAILCGALAIGVVVWTAVSIWRAYQSRRRAGANLIEARK